MPITMAAFTIGSLGLTGIPLFSGFIGKWNLIVGSLELGNIIPAVVIVVGSVLCAAYLFPVIRVAYFEPAPEEDWKDPRLTQKIALISLALAVLILGIIPGPFLELAERAAVELLALK
jgi:multicomponent Na+:H+ antiporter subunit D